MTLKVLENSFFILARTRVCPYVMLFYKCKVLKEHIILEVNGHGRESN